MNIFDPHITGSLSVSSSAQISGDLTVLGTIYGAAEITGEVTNAISASYAPSYVLTSSFEIYTASLDDTFATDSDVSALRGTLNTYTSSNNTTNTTQNGRLSSLEVKTGSLDTSISTINTLNTTQNNRLNSIEATTGSINLFTSSIETRVDDLETFSSSLDSTFATDSDVTTLRTNFNTYTSSNDTTNSTQNSRLGSLETKTGSLDSTNTTQNSRIGSLETKTGSLETTNTTQNGRLTSLETKTGSLETTNTTQNSRLLSIENATSSLDGRLDTIELGLEFTGSNLTIKGNLLVKGTQTTVNSTTVSIEDNIISLNGSGAANGGIEVRDVTSPGILSGSLIWDGLNNQWKGGTKSNEERLLTNTDLVGLDGRLDSIESFTASIDDTYATDADVNTLRTSLNTYTSSNDATNTTQNGRLTSLEVKTGSLDSTNTTQNTRLSSLETKTGSLDTSISTINTLNTTQNGRLTSLETKTGSLETTNTTQNSRLGSLETKSGSVDTSISNINTKLSGIDVTTGSLDSRIGVIEDAITNLDDTYATDSDITTLRGELNTYASSNNTTNTTQNGRLGSLETESGSIRSTLNSYTSSNNTTIGNIAGDLLLKGNRLDSIEQFTASIDDTFATDSDVTTLRGDLNTYTSSNNTTNTTQNSRLGSLETESGSIRVTFNSYTSSNNTINTTQNGRLGSLEVATGSLSGRLVSLETFSSSLDSTFATDSDVTALRGTLNTYTSSNDTTNTTQNSRLTSLETFSSSLDNTFATDNDVTALRGTLNTYTSSNDTTNTTQNSRLGSLETKTGSLDTSISTINTLNTTQNTRLSSLETKTGSLETTNTTQNGRLSSLETESGSVRSTLNTYTSSNDTTNTTQNSRLGSLETKTGSLDSTNSTQNSRISSLEVKTGSLDSTNTTQNGRLTSLETKTGSLDTTNTTQNGRLDSIETYTSSLKDAVEVTGSNLTIKGNLLVKGTETRVNSTTVEVSDNVISLNGSGAANGGIEVRDVTSPGVLSGSLIWDGLTNKWKGGTKGNEDNLVLEGGFNTYTSSNNATNTTQNNRLGSLETSTSSLNSFTSSINTTIKSKMNTEGVISGSLQINHDLTTNFSVNEHIDHSSVSIGSGKGLEGGGTIDTSRSLSLHTGSLHFLDGVKSKLNTETVVSGSIQIDITGTTNYNLVDGRLDSLETESGSVDGRLDTIESQTGSYQDGYNYSQVGHLPLAGGTMTGAGNITMPDNFELRAGTDSDLRIYNNGTNNFILNTVGNLNIRNTADDGNITFQSDDGSGGYTSYFLINGDSEQTQVYKDFRFQDDVKAKFGNTEDLQIYHDGSNSFIQDAGTGFLVIDTNGTDVRITKTDNEFMAKFVTDAQVELYYDNSKKFETTSTGVTVTGVIGATGGSSTDWNTAFGWGNHASAGYLTLHPSVSAAISSNNSGRTYIQDILLDVFGHITGITTATETVVNTDTNYYVTGATFSTSTGIITITKNDGSTVTVDIDGKYAESTHTHTFASITSKPTTLSGYGITDAATSAQGTKADSAYGWGNHASAGYANYSHKYHTFSAGDEYYDSYGQNNNLRLFTENATFDNFRFRSYSNVEYFDGTNWVAWGQSLDTLFDGREETGISLGHANSHFRFEINRSSGWPTTALFVIQSSWTDTNSHTCEVTLETWNGSAWVQKDNWTYSDFQRGINLHTTTNVHDGNAQMRVTINMDWVDASHNYYPIRRILLLSNFSGTAYDMQPFTWDYGKNVTFASQIYVSGGNSSQWNTSYGWGNHAGLYSLVSHTHTFASITSKPTTLSGYGITDAATSTQGTNADTAFGWGNHAGLYSLVSHTHTFASLTSKPTTLVGYGITDAATSTQGTKADSAYGWGNHASAGYLTAHPSVTASVSSNNSGRTYIQDILLDGFGHITGITTATETVVNTDTNYYTTGATFSTSTGVITLTRNDGTTVTVDIDGRYLQSYTETDTLSSVVSRGSSTTSQINVGAIDIAGGGYTMWVNSYAVSDTNIGALTDSSGNNIATGGAYRVTAHISGTGTDQSSKAVIWNQNGTWYVNETTRSGSSSNHIQFLIHNEVPSVKTWHSNNYNVSVLFERINLYEDTGTDNTKDYWGTDSYMSNISDNVTFNLAAGGSVTAPKFVKSGGTSSQFLKADGSVDTNTYLTAHPSVSATTSSNNSGRTYIQDILLDGFGHITGITTATETVVNTDTNYYTTGSTFNSTNGIATFTRNDGGTYTLNLLSTLSDVTVTGGTYNSGNQTLTLTKSDGNTVSVSGFAIDTDVNWYTTGATFSTSTGVITFTRNNGGTYTVDIDGKYAESGHNHNGTYMYAHVGNGGTFNDLTGAKDSNYVTFDATSIVDAPSTHYYNGFVSTHANYLSSYILQKHRTDEWYLGWRDNSTTPSSTWVKVWHDGNLTNLNQLTNGPGYITEHPAVSAASSSNNGGRTYIQDILLDSFGHITGITTATETVVNTDTNYYTTGSTFNTTNGIITFTRNDGGTYTVDVDGKYAEASHTHSYVPLAGGTMTGSLLFSNDIGTAIQGTIGTNDFWRIYASSTASNAGYLEISTSDDGTEPIYVRQYTGVFATLVRTATLLDGSGNTSFPNTLTAGTIVKSGGTSLQYLMADGSVSTNPGWLTTHPTIAGASSNNSGRTYIQDILTDGNGHVTGITTASETVVNTDTNYYVSSAAFNTGDGVLTLSRNGLSAVTVDLDGRYQATGTYLGAINYNNDSNANYQLLWGSGNAVYGTAGVYLNPSTDYVYGASFNASDWFRSSGNTGWYNSTYSGGWYMTDSSYIRPYNGKSLSMDNGSIDYVSQLHFNDNVRFYDEGNNQYLNYKWGNSGAGGIKFVDGDDTLQGYVYGSGTGSFGLLDSGSNWKVRVDSSNVEMYGTQYLTTVYANFIYDRDNTAYYLNPAGGSNLNTLTLNSTTAGSTVLNVQGTQGQLFSITDDLTGDLFSVSDASGVPIFNVNANGTVSIDSLGSLVIGGNPVLTAHPSVTAAGSSNNSGRTYIQDILLDAFGHITGITTATETVVNTDTNTVTSVGIVGDLSTGNITLVGSGSTTVTKSGGTITITSTDTNTTYSVGDGGLTQFNFTTAFRDKLNGIEASANNYVHPTTTGNKHIPTGGSSGQILRWSADGTASWGSDVDTNTTYTAGTGLTLTGTVFSVTAGTYAAASHTHTFASLTSKPTTISGYGITDAITTGNIGSQSVDYATRSKWIDFPDGPRDLSDRRPDWNDRSVAWDFVTAASVGGAGQYAGVMTFSPWDGTAASTGDSSYQLAFHNQTGVNSSGAPGLKIRNGIDATWKSWRKVALVNTVTFSNVTSVTFEHGLGTDNVVVQVYDGGGDLFFPSAIRSSGGNVSVVFEIARSGRVVVTG